MSARSKFQDVLLLALSLLVAAPLAAYGQDQPARMPETLRHRNRLATVSLPANTVAAEFTVSAAPVRVRAVRAAPAGQGRGVEAPPAPPAPPDPVNPQTMSRLNSALSGGGSEGATGRDFQAPGPPVLDHIELTPRTPWVSGKGHVQTLLAYEANPTSPSWTFNKNFPGAMTVSLKVDKDETYLVDFAVSSWGSGTYRVETEAGVQEFADGQGNLEHVLVALNASDSGWVNVGFRRDGTGYYAYSVTVNRME